MIHVVAIITAHPGQPAKVKDLTARRVIHVLEPVAAG
jgi:hypothetical protein